MRSKQNVQTTQGLNDYVLSSFELYSATNVNFMKKVNEPLHYSLEQEDLCTSQIQLVNKPNLFFLFFHNCREKV